jgi:prepilin-type N-terminal cleavage/methylation domain-containing protein
MNRRGVTLIEMLIVVAIIGAIVSISFPSLSAGLAGIRLSSASGSVASFLTSAMNNVERREQPSAIVVDPEHSLLAVYTSDSGEKPREQLAMPQGISIEGDKPRRFMLFPGGAFPRIMIVLKSDRGAKKSIEIDPITAVPKIQ